MKALDRMDAGALWGGRLTAAGQVCQRLQPNWTLLEDALAGMFPRVVPRRVLEKESTRSSWDGDDEQINLNVSLAVHTYMTALTFYEEPALRWGRFPDEDANTVNESERLLSMLMADADATAECRRAMRYMMTRGSWALGISVHRTNATPEEIRAQSIPAEDFVLAARTGNLTEIPYGIDYFKVGEMARSVLEDPAQALGILPEERARIAQLAETCEVEHAKLQALPRAPRVKAKIAVEALPMGTWFRFDPTVTDFRKARWAARKIVMTPEEFAADPAFTDEAKAKIHPIRMKGTEPALEIIHGDLPPDKALEESGRIVLWEIHDRVYRKRHYTTESGYGGLCEKDDTSPWLDAEGEPIFPHFFPFVFRTPIQHNREKPEQAFGIPYLAPGWPIQLEIIKTRSAYYNATKRSARVAVASSMAEDSTIEAYVAAQDGAVIKAKAGYDATKDGPLFQRVDMGNAPLDYLQASMRLMADYANMERVPLSALTGEPVADTLGQEQMAMQGASVTQTDVVRALESGYSELSWMVFRLFQIHASSDEFLAYLGRSSVKPNKEGVPIHAAIKAMGVDGRRLTAKFASTIRAENLARNKQLMDFYALSMGPLGRDSTGIPFFDGKSQLINIAKEADIEGLVPYQPSEAEMISAALTKAMGTMNNGATPGEAGDKTGRKAGGQRGAADVPGRQDRNEGPPDQAKMNGVAQRPQNALA